MKVSSQNFNKKRQKRRRKEVELKLKSKHLCKMRLQITSFGKNI